MLNLREGLFIGLSRAADEKTSTDNHEELQSSQKDLEKKDINSLNSISDEQDSLTSQNNITYPHEALDLWNSKYTQTGVDTLSKIQLLQKKLQIQEQSTQQTMQDLSDELKDLCDYTSNSFEQIDMLKRQLRQEMQPLKFLFQAIKTQEPTQLTYTQQLEMQNLAKELNQHRHKLANIYQTRLNSLEYVAQNLDQQIYSFEDQILEVKLDTQHDQKQFKEDYPIEFLNYDNFLKKSDRTGGWDSDDHEEFLRAHHITQGDISQVLQILNQSLGKYYNVQQIQQHIDWYQTLQELQIKKSQVVKEWRAQFRQQSINKDSYSCTMLSVNKPQASKKIEVIHLENEKDYFTAYQLGDISNSTQKQLSDSSDRSNNKQIKRSLYSQNKDIEQYNKENGNVLLSNKSQVESIVNEGILQQNSVVLRRKVSLSDKQKQDALLVQQQQVQKEKHAKAQIKFRSKAQRDLNRLHQPTASHLNRINQTNKEKLSSSQIFTRTGLHSNTATKIPQRSTSLASSSQQSSPRARSIFSHPFKNSNTSSSSSSTRPSSIISEGGKSFASSKKQHGDLGRRLQSLRESHQEKKDRFPKSQLYRIAEQHLDRLNVVKQHQMQQLSIFSRS